MVRKDLGPARIAAMGMHEGVASAAVYSGLGLFHEQSPTLSWSLDGQELGEGYDVSLPSTGLLELVVSLPDGQVLEGSVQTTPSATEPVTVSRSSVQITDDALNDPTLATRLELSTEPVDGSVPSGQAARLELSGAAEQESLRWMSAAGAGTLLELSERSADLLAEELVFDDGVLESREDAGDGLYHQLVLLMDGVGGNRWIWVDAAVGVDAPLLRHGERLVTVPEGTAPGLVAATLARADSVAGIALSDVVPVEDLTEQDIACGVPDRAFELSWLAEGRCAMDELDGARVVLELR